MDSPTQAGELQRADVLEQHLSGRDTPCPKCRYNLRGLRGRTTCPECGVGLHLEVAATPRSPGAVWVPLLALAAGATWPTLQVIFVTLTYLQTGTPLSRWLYLMVPGGLACVAFAGLVHGWIRRRRRPFTAWRWAVAALACNGAVFTVMLILPRLWF